MAEVQLPQSLEVALPAMVELAVEWWRLKRVLNKPSGAAGGAVRHALGKIEDVLRRCDLEVQTLDGRPFDPGLAVHVVDVIEDRTLPHGQAVIEETISPLVLWRGRVIKVSEVVTRRGPK